MTMININRERLYDKIRALLDKTVANGCTEAEALSALSKARAMMDAYEVTPEDLKLAKEQAAVLRGTETRDDKHGIARYLVRAVALFCDCDGWRHGEGFVFCGAPSDVQLAEWLHKHLITFVQGELENYLYQSDAPRGMRRRMINGFVLGCTGRILARVQELEMQSRRTARSHSNALVIIKGDAIRAVKEAAGITVKRTTSRRRYTDDSLSAGKAAGDRATLSMPVDGRGAMMLK